MFFDIEKPVSRRVWVIFGAFLTSKSQILTATESCSPCFDVKKRVSSSRIGATGTFFPIGFANRMWIGGAPPVHTPGGVTGGPWRFVPVCRGVCFLGYASRAAGDARGPPCLCGICRPLLSRVAVAPFSCCRLGLIEFSCLKTDRHERFRKRRYYSGFARKSSESDAKSSRQHENEATATRPGEAIRGREKHGSSGSFLVLKTRHVHPDLLNF